jgi:hypothetical protein
VAAITAGVRHVRTVADQRQTEIKSMINLISPNIAAFNSPRSGITPRKLVWGYDPAPMKNRRIGRLQSISPNGGVYFERIEAYDGEVMSRDLVGHENVGKVFDISSPVHMHASHKLLTTEEVAQHWWQATVPTQLFYADLSFAKEPFGSSNPIKIIGSKPDEDFEGNDYNLVDLRDVDYGDWVWRVTCSPTVRAFYRDPQFKGRDRCWRFFTDRPSLAGKYLSEAKK